MNKEKGYESLSRVGSDGTVIKTTKFLVVAVAVGDDDNDKRLTAAYAVKRTLQS